LKIRFILRFCPESFELIAMAGLLTYSLFGGLPIRRLANSGKRMIQKYFCELTAAGTVPDFHGIPNYAFISEVK
jgi:hypothetical protein